MKRRISSYMVLALAMTGCTLFQPPAPPPRYFEAIERRLQYEGASQGRITMRYNVLLPFGDDVYVEVIFEDLVNENDSFETGYTLLNGDDELFVRSPLVNAHRPYTDYEIRLEVYRDAGKLALLHTHRDLIRFLTGP